MNWNDVTSTSNDVPTLPHSPNIHEPNAPGMTLQPPRLYPKSQIKQTTQDNQITIDANTVRFRKLWRVDKFSKYVNQ